jgi:NAD(P)-dependent dehydrogenase (short-subunit alcohol dehydrogenase family)
MSPASKTIIVTGGAQGLGKGMVRHFAGLGWSVVFVDRDAEAGNETAAEVSGSRFIHGDVTEPGLPERVVAECLASAGQVNALINNAGVSEFVPIEQLSVEQFRRILDTNLVAYFAWAKAAVSALRASHGAIVNIASTRALQSEPHGEAYGASKGGVVALTHALAISLGPDIRVNSISPGWIEVGPLQKKSQRRLVEHSDVDLSQHPVGRVGVVEDVAYLAEFLCSDHSGFITGQNHVVDGGMTKKMIYSAS